MAGLLDEYTAQQNQPAPGLLGPLMQRWGRALQGPDANFDRWMKLKALELQQKSLEEKPQITDVEFDDGTKGKATMTVGGGFAPVWPPKTDPRWGQMTGAGTGAPAAAGAAPPVPPGMDAKVFRKERSEAAAKQEGELVTSARQASAMLPKVQEMIDAYKIANDRGAIGPWAGGSVARTLGQYFPADPNFLGPGKPLLPGATAQAEAARQNYERRKSPVQAYITTLQNKGQGPVSEWERKLFGLALPGFTDLDPDEQMRVMTDLKTEMEHAIKAGKASPISAAPGVSEALKPQPQSARAQPGAPRKVSQQEYQSLPAGAQYIAPDGSVRTKR